MGPSGTSEAGRSPRKRRGWRAICTESVQRRARTSGAEWSVGKRGEGDSCASTHEGPDALPVHVHRDGREPADGLARAEDEQGDFDAAGDDDAVGEEGRAVEDHVLREVGDGEDVQRVGAVRIEQVGHRGPSRYHHAEVEHPAA